jgi:mono/diheme cytochrome c family protein
MPSLGYRLTDSEVAAVVTYIRNSWGNAASAVTADAVKAVRDRVSDPVR